MSVDIQGWYYAKNEKDYVCTRCSKRFLYILGVNHSDSDFGVSYWNVDKKLKFMEQVDVIIKKLYHSGDMWTNEELNKYRQQAKKFKKEAKKKGKKIFSYWG
jgi:hypothetical protein